MLKVIIIKKVFNLKIFCKEGKLSFTFKSKIFFKKIIIIHSLHFFFNLKLFSKKKVKFKKIHESYFLSIYK
jgi:hypothetical protein